jgi:hypothetical protein
LAAIFADTPQVELEEDAPVMVDEDKPTRVQPGDIWRVGEHIVACLDSTEPSNLDRVLAGRKVGMVVADPPYGISIVKPGGLAGNNSPIVTGKATRGRVSERLGSIGGAKPFGDAPRSTDGGSGRSNIIAQGLYPPVIGDDSIDTAVSAAGLCIELFPDATHFWWGANNYAHMLPPSTCWIVWDKENTGSFADAELAWSNHKSAVRIFKHMWNGLMKASERGERRAHPTQKPDRALMRWPLKNMGSAGRHHTRSVPWQWTLASRRHMR